MIISHELLKRRCNWVMAQAKAELAVNQTMAPTFYFGRGAGPQLHRLRLTVMAEWMNDGALKAHLFSYVRWAVHRYEFDCVIFFSDIWAWTTYPSFQELPKDVQEKFYRESRHLIVELGYGERTEALSVMGQTAEHFFGLALPYHRDRDGKVSSFGDEKVLDSDSWASQLGGRIMMFGDWGEPGMKETYEKVGHELEGLIDDPRVKTILDLSNLPIVNIEAP